MPHIFTPPYPRTDSKTFAAVSTEACKSTNKNPTATKSAATADEAVADTDSYFPLANLSIANQLIPNYLQKHLLAPENVVPRKKLQPPLDHPNLLLRNDYAKPH